MITIFIFVLNFDTNHYQIGENRLRRQTPGSCNLQSVNGTTAMLKEIFIGRCYYYINVLQKTNCQFNSAAYNCNLIWDKFYSISVQNSTRVEDYNELLNMVDMKIPENTSLFWSGTYTQAHEC